MNRRTEAAASLLLALFQLIRSLKRKRDHMKASEQRLIDYDIAMMVNIGSDIHKYLSWSDLSFGEMQGRDEVDCAGNSNDYAERFLHEMNHAITLLKSWPFDNPMLGRQMMKQLYELQSYYSDLLSHDEEFLIGPAVNVEQVKEHRDEERLRARIQARRGGRGGCSTNEQTSWKQELAVGSDVNDLDRKQDNKRSSLPEEDYILSKIGSWTSVKKLNPPF